MLILGAGTIGTAVAWDLTHIAPVADVTVADHDPAALARVASALPVATARIDAAAPDTIVRLALQHDVVVGALPSRFGHAVLHALCEAGRRYCDVSFMPEDARGLDQTARRYGAVVVHDCGVAPGLSHAIVGDAVTRLATCDRVRIEVGGLPGTQSPLSSTRRHLRHRTSSRSTRVPCAGCARAKSRIVEALSEVQTVRVDGVGPLDSFLTDGLRSLVDTVSVREMDERTLRHPGHLPLMVALRDAGFFDTRAIDVDGQRVAPRDLTSRLLFPHWAYEEGERDVTVLRVEVRGTDANGAEAGWVWELVDRPAPALSGSLSSMARTTAFPAAIVARWLADGTISEPGVHAPETLGFRGLTPALLTALEARGINVARTQ